MAVLNLDHEAAYQSFEDAIRAAPELGSTKGAIIDVLDTAYIVEKWFAAYSPDAKASEIVGMTALILERAQQMRKETRRDAAAAKRDASA